MSGHKITHESGKKIARFFRNLQHQPPRRHKNTRPFDGGMGRSIEFTIISISTAGTSSPYNGLTIAFVTVEGASPGLESLIGTTVDVVDHLGCVFDLSSGDLADAKGLADWKRFASLKSGAASGELTPGHWAALDRCCIGGA